MAAGVTGTTQLNELVKRAVTAARLTLQGRAFVRPMFDNLTLPRNTDTSLKIPKLATVTAYGLTEGVDMTQAQQVTDSVVTCTPAEVGVQVNLTRKQVQTSSEDSRSKIGRVQGDAYNKKSERDVMSLFSGFNTDLGAAAETFDHDNIGRAVSNIRGDTTEPNDGRAFFIGHPHHFFDIEQSLTQDPASNVGNIGTGLSDELFREHMVGRLHRSTLFESTLMSVDSSDDAVACVAVKESLISVIFMQPKMDPEWDASLRAWELNYVGDYGQVEYQGIWGYAITSDAAAQS